MVTALCPVISKQVSFHGKAIIETNVEAGLITLYSYNTKVCSIKVISQDDVEVALYNPDSNLTKTTLKHVKEFLLQNGLKAESKAQILRDYNIVKED